MLLKSSVTRIEKRVLHDWIKSAEPHLLWGRKNWLQTKSKSTDVTLCALGLTASVCSSNPVTVLSCDENLISPKMGQGARTR